MVFMDKDLEVWSSMGGYVPRKACVLVDEAIFHHELDAATEVCLCIGEVHGRMPILRTMTPE